MVNLGDIWRTLPIIGVTTNLIRGRYQNRDLKTTNTSIICVGLFLFGRVGARFQASFKGDQKAHRTIPNMVDVLQSNQKGYP